MLKHPLCEQEKMSEGAASEKIDFYKVDVDEQEEIAKETGVRAMPTFMFFKDGQKVHEVQGAVPPALQVRTGSVLIELVRRLTLSDNICLPILSNVTCRPASPSSLRSHTSNVKCDRRSVWPNSQRAVLPFCGLHNCPRSQTVNSRACSVVRLPAHRPGPVPGVLSPADDASHGHGSDDSC